MRNTFLNTLFDLAKLDARIVFITGDLGFGVVEAFMEQLPKQFLNAGVAEQNMTGLAAGLALTNRVVFTYSIGNFPTLRCLEQIRNDVCYHGANVKIVTVGGGFAYGALGASHHATEDLAIMRALPGMTVVAPGDPIEAAAATRALAAMPGPAYLRLGKAGEPKIHAAGVHFELGRAIVVRPGRAMTLIVAGGLLEATVAAADALAASGIDARVLSMHTIKPLDADAIVAAARETGAILTIEEHSILGGLGGAVAEVLAEAGTSASFQRFGLPSAFDRKVGSQAYLREAHGLTPAGIGAAARALHERARAKRDRA